MASPPKARTVKLLTVVGARPQFIKAAAVSRAIGEYRGQHPGVIDEIICHTGQHYDREMSQAFFDELQIPLPHHHLGIGSLSHGAQTGRMLEALETIMTAQQPNWVLVYGDTNSTLAGALAAAKLRIPIAHVEAGLRSYNRAMPEEINRLVADHLAQLHFCPTPTAVDNLRREGITAGVHQVGDVMLDMVWASLDIAHKRSDVLERLGLVGKRYYLATLHRPVNTDDPTILAGIFSALDRLEVPVILPAHPRLRHALEHANLLGQVPASVRLEAPMPYFDMLLLQSHADLVLTDSGGVQKEARILRTPCVTLREETEWTETLDGGWNRLAGSDPKRIVESVREVERLRGSLDRDARPPYGSGQASQAVVRTILQSR